MSKPNAYMLGSTIWKYEFDDKDNEEEWSSYSWNDNFLSDDELIKMGAVPVTGSKQIEKLDEFDSNSNRQLTEKINEIIDHLQKG